MRERANTALVAIPSSQEFAVKHLYVVTHAEATHHTDGLVGG
ncbi:MAG TPA: hypothetical protein VKB09_08970 [Thermomicrobiales bacterium]|nr:hypothetical protein [Thermomicrobiales bacterium]